MKKIFLFITVIYSSLTYSQVFIDCYTDGDTLSDDVIDNAIEFKIKNNQLQLKSFEITIYSSTTNILYKGKINTLLISSEIKKLMKGEKRMPLKIEIDNIIVEVVNKDGSRYMNPTTFYRAKTTHKNCNKKSIYTVTYKGKILSGENKDKPVQHQKIVVLDNKNEVIDTATTDNYGDFALMKLNKNEPYQIILEENTAEFSELHLAKQNGIIVDEFKKTNNTFIYELTANKIKLMDEKEESSMIKLKQFISSKDQQITIVENIYYKTNSAEIELTSLPTLNKIVKVLQENKTLKLSILSHTDANGDDEYNLKLSEKRAQKVMAYFLSKGISKDRLSTKGLGETQLLNRCKNGIDCSEEEHKLNRRTVFKFTKI